MSITNEKVITAWDEGNTIKAVVKRDGKHVVKTIKNWDWFFCLSNDDYARINPDLFNKYFKLGIILKIEELDDYVRIYANRNTKAVIGFTEVTIRNLHRDLVALRVTPLEIDLPLFKHWLHNNNVQIEDDLEILFFDIETDDTIGNIEIGRDRILSFAGCNTKGEIFYISYDDEKQILVEAIELIHKHDVFVGWNSAKFDLPYIQARMKKHGLEYDWRKRIHLDMMLRLIKLFASISGLLGLSGFSLNEIVRVFLKDEKLPHTEKIIDMFHNNKEKLKEYNIKDTTLLRDLNEKIHIMPLMIKECVWTGTFLNQFYIGELLDNYIIREARKHGMYLRSKPTWDQQQELEKVNVRGAYVQEPIIGAYNNVRIFDFKSLYPSIIISWNIGEDTLNRNISSRGQANMITFLGERRIEDVPYDEFKQFLVEQKKLLDPDNLHFQTGNNCFFTKAKKSFVAKLIQDLLDQRKVFKDKLNALEIDTDDYRTARAEQEVVKEMANSMFGITAEKKSRYFDLMICEAITLSGQFLNRSTRDITEKMHGYPVIYGDTDSLFVVIQDNKDADASEHSINAGIKKFLKDFFQIEETIVYLEYEKAYGRLLMMDKKKYTGHLTSMDGKEVSKIFSRGTENVKKDTVGYTRRHIVPLIEMLVKEEQPLEVCLKWLMERREEVRTANLPVTDLTVTVKISKPTNKYKTESLQVRIAKDLIKKGLLMEANEGKTNATRITYVVTSAEDKMDGVSVEDYKEGVWDRKYYWDVKIYAPFKRLLEVAFPDYDWEQYLFAEEERRNKLAERNAKKKAKEEEAAAKKLAIAAKKEKAAKDKEEKAAKAAELKASKKRLKDSV